MFAIKYYNNQMNPFRELRKMYDHASLTVNPKDCRNWLSSGEFPSKNAVGVYPQSYKDYIEYFEWCRDNCSIWTSRTIFFSFREESDAVLFKLLYGEKRDDVYADC